MLGSGCPLFAGMLIGTITLLGKLGRRTAKRVF